jgi:hypothetical protein
MAEARRFFCAFCGTSLGALRYGDNAPCGGCGQKPFHEAPAPVSALEEARRKAPAFPREHLLNSLREAAKFKDHSQRIVILQKWEVEDILLAWDAKHDEAGRLRERLDQFEAAGFPSVAAVLDRVAALPPNAGESQVGDRFIDVVFDGPPEHDAGRFVEVEDEHGSSIRVGEWVHRPDGLWALRIPRVPSPSPPRPLPEGVREAAEGAIEKLLLFAEHDFECEWFRYDSAGFHRSCSCGRDESVAAVRAVVDEALSAAPAPLAAPCGCVCEAGRMLAWCADHAPAPSAKETRT